jgi:acyl-CoA thioester hydrolase
MTAPHEWGLRVYIEDTDAGGIVYYANYLKFMERARTEMLRSIGAPHSEMIEATQTQFVVQYCNVRFHKPARLEDEIVIRTELKELGAASLALKQDVVRGDVLLVSAEVGLAVVNSKGSPCRMDAAIKRKIEEAL